MTMQPDKVSLKNFFTYILKAILLGLAIFLLTWDFNSFKKTTFNDVEQKQIQKIDLVIMLSEIAKNPDKVVIIDTRLIDYYKQGRIPGAISLEVSSVDGISFETIVHKYNSSHEVEYVIIYGNRSDPTAEIFAMKLYEAGLEKVQLFYPGYEQWHACGLPIVKDEGL